MLGGVPTARMTFERQGIRVENLVKVKLLDNHEYKGVQYQQYAIIDVEPQHANSMIDGGYAEKVTESKPVFEAKATSAK